jgi:hypothetical protein
MVSGELVVFCVWSPKAPGEGEKESDGVPEATPVPVKGTLFGLDAASVVKVRLAVLAVAVVGEKTTFNEHEAAAASVAPQVLPFVENSPELAPVNAMLLIVNKVLPELVSVTAVFPLDVPVF